MRASPARTSSAGVSCAGSGARPAPPDGVGARREPNSPLSSRARVCETVFFFFHPAAASLSAARGDRRAAPFSSTASGAFAPSESPETLSGSFSSFPPQARRSSSLGSPTSATSNPRKSAPGAPGADAERGARVFGAADQAPRRCVRAARPAAASPPPAEVGRALRSRLRARTRRPDLLAAEDGILRESSVVALRSVLQVAVRIVAVRKRLVRNARARHSGGNEDCVSACPGVVPAAVCRFRVRRFLPR